MGSSTSFTQEHHYGTISNLLGPMVRNIANRYFINSQCVCVITQENGDILKYIPNTISVFHIQIGGTGSTIQEIENSDTLDSTKLKNETQKFERLLIQAMNAGCDAYIVQVRNVQGAVHSFARTTRRAITRKCKKFIYLPLTAEGENIQLRNVFSMKEMNYMPDVITARFLNARKLPNFFRHKYESMNCKDKHYKSKEIMNSSIDIARKLPQAYHDNNEKQACFNNIDNKITARGQKATKFATFDGDSCMEAPDDIIKMSNASINLLHASGLTQASDSTNVIKLVTLKFVGKNPSSEVLLDVWVTDIHNPGFLTCADLFPDKMGNLEGKEVKVTTFNYLPFVVLTHDEKTPVYGGIEFLTFMEFATKLNFTWKLVLDEDNFWGAAWPNGSGNGVVGKKY